MKKILNIYNSASTVAALWILSPLLPFAMFSRDNEDIWMPYVGMVIFVIFVVSITKYRNQKKEKNTWKISDLVAYILVPSSLFILFTVVVLNTV